MTSGANKAGWNCFNKIITNGMPYSDKAEETISGFNKLCPQDYIEIIVISKND